MARFRAEAPVLLAAKALVLPAADVPARLAVEVPALPAGEEDHAAPQVAEDQDPQAVEVQVLQGVEVRAPREGEGQALELGAVVQTLGPGTVQVLPSKTLLIIFLVEDQTLLATELPVAVEVPGLLGKEVHAPLRVELQALLGKELNPLRRRKQSWRSMSV